MNPIERALAILLLLSRRRLVSATALAERFEVSVRTIYRDIDRLTALGIPVEAERGAEGGFRLASEYLVPPIALDRVETTALLVALSLVRGLKATPLLDHLQTAENKLLAALPQAAREILADGARIVGIEQTPDDIFHFERVMEGPVDQQRAVDGFLQGILTQRRVELLHRNPYRGSEKLHEAEPHGLLWDRDLWYLVGRSVQAGEMRMWRADRVASASVTGMSFRPARDFDIRALLKRQWLENAMRRWDLDGEGTRIRLTAETAAKLRRDWYYRHAAFTADGRGGIIMAIPDLEPDLVLPLVRWLGPGAELVGPQSLREKLCGELDAIRRSYG